MLELIFAQARIHAFLHEISELQNSEFPYPDSRRAMAQIFGHIKKLVLELDNLAENTAFLEQRELARSQGKSDGQDEDDPLQVLFDRSLTILYYCLPVLGFILRSTNVRNGFELLGPLRRIARQLLEPDQEDKFRQTKLLISSEWDYSPHLRRDSRLRDFVMIGLPAHESANPLLFPLSGHELGHVLWVRDELEAEYRGTLEASIRPNVPKGGNDFQTFRTTRQLLNWATKQAEESFCDFVGVRMFGPAYFLAFTYLLFPGNIGPRLPTYPKTLVRIRNLRRAMISYGLPAPAISDTAFADRDEEAQIELDLLGLADSAVASVVETLIDKAGQLVQEAEIPQVDWDEVKKIRETFELIVPASQCKSLADILNAGWEAFKDPHLWTEAQHKHVTGRQYEVLKELLLKNIQLFDVEQLQELSGRHKQP